MSTRTRLNLRTMTLTDEPEVLSLLTASLSGGPTGGRTSEFFAWKHRDNPFGPSPGLVALDGERVVGVRLFLRWQLRYGARVLRAVRAVDTATHPEFQRRGIFKALTLSLLDSLERQGEVDLVFNTPNADSRPGYLRMGWQPVGQLPVRISPVRPVRFLRGARGASVANSSGSAAAVAQVDAPTTARPCPLPRALHVLAASHDVADLLARRAVPGRLHTPLSSTYLAWRYGNVPGLDYRAVPVYRGARLVGLGLGRVRTRAALTELTLGDVIVAEGDRGAARAVLRAARRSGVDHVAIHAPRGSEVDLVARASGYFTTPRRGIGLVANPRAGCPSGVLEPDRWSLSLGDLEVF